MIMAQDTEQRLSLRHYPASRSIVLLWLDLVAASLEQPAPDANGGIGGHFKKRIMRAGRQILFS
jgi:hypothetical protein